MLGLWDWSPSRKPDCNPGMRRGPSPQLILPMLPRCKSSLVLSRTWHVGKRMVFTDVLEIWSSTECPVEASAGSSDVSFAQFSFSVYPQMEQLPKGDFHCWLPSLLFLANSVLYSSPVNICGRGRNLEGDFQWVMAKIIDKKPTPLAGLIFNNLNWPPRGEWGIPGQCISETPVGPITSGHGLPLLSELMWNTSMAWNHTGDCQPSQAARRPA